ncbi:MAG: alpha-ketoglutarate-dependent dioxygenase AlkB [Gemmataceae bacterium]
MATLFPIPAEIDVPRIPGLTYLSDYITDAEEQRLVQLIEALPWDTSWQRRRQLYGAGYGRAEAAAPIPDWGQTLAQRLLSEGITDVPFDNMLINEYFPGQGISLHRDYDPFGRTVVSLSLLSACVMDFRHAVSGQKEHILLQPRSLLVLSDTARFDWQHGIAPRKTDVWHGERLPRGRRLSVTFRFRK